MAQRDGRRATLICRALRKEHEPGTRKVIPEMKCCHGIGFRAQSTSRQRSVCKSMETTEGIWRIPVECVIELSRRFLRRSIIPTISTMVAALTDFSLAKDRAMEVSSIASPYQAEPERITYLFAHPLQSPYTGLFVPLPRRRYAILP